MNSSSVYESTVDTCTRVLFTLETEYLSPVTRPCTQTLHRLPHKLFQWINATAELTEVTEKNILEVLPGSDGHTVSLCTRLYLDEE